MTNNTYLFLNIVNDVMNENKAHFTDLKEKKKSDPEYFREKIFNDFQLPYSKISTPYNSNELFINSIKDYILIEKDNFSMDTKVLCNISTQLEIEYLLKKRKKGDVLFFCSISNALNAYGIYNEKKIVSFENTIFWKNLIKMIYLLTLMYPTSYSNLCNEDVHETSFFNGVSKLTKAIKEIETNLKEKIDVIDGIVVFKDGQEEKIIKKIEKRLHKFNLFFALECIFHIYDNDKKNNHIEDTYPYRYIVNILVKNIYKSNHKCRDEKKIVNIFNLLKSFMHLYKLRSPLFEIMLTSNRIDFFYNLKKLVLCSNFYPIYHIKTDTLIDFIVNLIHPSIDNQLFLNKFGFNINELILFFKELDRNTDNVIYFSEDNIFNNEKKILELFSINANEINNNYSSKINFNKNNKLFVMNPILKYKNRYYVIGFKYFKMNFYNSLVEKIRNGFDKDINKKIGVNIDIFVKKIFNEIKNKHHYEIFSGSYVPPKKESPESDLLLKSENEIILIENKNKYLTNASFSGSESEILKDLTLSIGNATKQLLKHEINLKRYKEIKFKNDPNTLIYDNQLIIKIVISTNNWYSVMNIPSRNIIETIANLKINDESNKNHKTFTKVNKHIDELSNVIEDISKLKHSEMSIVLTQMLFLPLELVVEKYNDDNFFKNLKTLVQMKMNTDNILNIYDYCEHLNKRSK